MPEHHVKGFLGDTLVWDCPESGRAGPIGDDRLASRFGASLSPPDLVSRWDMCVGADSCPALFTARQEPHVLPGPNPAAKKGNPDPGQFRLLERKCTARVIYIVTQNMKPQGSIAWDPGAPCRGSQGTHIHLLEPKYYPQKRAGSAFTLPDSFMSWIVRHGTTADSRASCGKVVTPGRFGS